MKKGFILIVSFIMFFSSAYLINADVFKPGVSNNIKNLKKIKTPLIKMPYIKFISQDLTPGETIEVEGKNFGTKTLKTKFYVGSYLAEIIGWSDTFIKLKFPTSPTLGKNIKSYIKRGNTIVSNQKEHKLMALAYKIKPKNVLYKYNSSTTFVELYAGWTGTNKSGMSLRFMSKSINPKIKMYFSQVLSINSVSGGYSLKANLPSGMKEGTYLVNLLQNGRVASEPSFEFKVVKLIPFKGKINIK